MLFSELGDQHEQQEEHFETTGQGDGYQDQPIGRDVKSPLKKECLSAGKLHAFRLVPEDVEHQERGQGQHRPVETPAQIPLPRRVAENKDEQRRKDHDITDPHHDPRACSAFPDPIQYFGEC